MNIIRIRNVHKALPLALEILKTAGEKRDSRNGPVYMAREPVTTVYEKPCERVMFWAQRDANPFFHFFESLWMLGGRYDVPSVARFAGNMENYSDDGRTFWGAYGRRWRQGMPRDLVTDAVDQLPKIADQLRANPDDRRSVLQMWDGLSDLGHTGKDVPCNTMATFQVDSDGYLNMSVFNRSNDIVWGCYGANAVHFSVLQEYVALRAGYKVGTYTQISVNWHGYESTFLPLYDKFADWEKDVASLAEEVCPYEGGQVTPYPLMVEGWNEQWELQLHRLLNARGRAPTEGVWEEPFFGEVAIPILRAHDVYKDTQSEERYPRALEHLRQCRAADWKMACGEWITRRWNKFRKDADDGPTPT